MPNNTQNAHSIYGNGAQITIKCNLPNTQKCKIRLRGKKICFLCGKPCDMRKKQFCYDKAAIPAAKKV